MPVVLPPGFARAPGRHRGRNFKHLNIIFATLQDQIDFLAQALEERRGTPVQDFAALKAIPPEDRQDKEDRLVEDANAIYRFDAESTAPDDGNLVIEPDSGTGRWLRIAGVAGGFAAVTDTFTPTSGQTVFVLSTSYIGTGAPVWAFVNGIFYELGVDYTLSGTTFTWLDVDFTLDVTDSLVVVYTIS